MLNFLLIRDCLVVSFHVAEVNIHPLSVILSLGSPCTQNISLMDSCENCYKFICLAHGKKGGIFVGRSMMIRTASDSFYLDKSVMKPIDIDFHS